MRRITILILIILALALAPAARAAEPPGEPWTGQVVRVIDGDTVVVKPADGGKPAHVRLWGANCPEITWPAGQAAASAARKLMMNQAVVITPMGRSYKRIVGKILLPDGRDAAEEMIRLGWAKWSRKYAPAETKYQAAEAEAEAAGRGMWACLNSDAQFLKRARDDLETMRLLARVRLRWEAADILARASPARFDRD